VSSVRDDDLRATVTNKVMDTGEITKQPLKPFAQGRPVVRLEPVVNTLVCFFILHTGLWVRATHLAFPAPSDFSEGSLASHRSGATRAVRMRTRAPSLRGALATKQSRILRAALDCFAPFAMTTRLAV
jgi:hypothetical protein